MMNGRKLMMVGLLTLMALCFAACGGGDEIINTPVGDDATDATVPAVVDTAAADTAVVTDAVVVASATPFGERMVAIATSEPVDSTDSTDNADEDDVVTPVAVSTETPSDTASMSTPAPVVAADTPEPTATEAVATVAPIATEEPVVVVEATPAPEATVVVAATPVSSGGSITPYQIGATDWGAYADEGYVFYTEYEGERLEGVRDEHDKVVRCGPEIGTSFDREMNPTARDDSHYLWIWSEDDSGTNCVAFSKYVDWANEVDWANGTLPNLRETASIENVADDDPRRASGGQDLVFFYQVADRSYTMPPVPDVPDQWSATDCSEGYEAMCFPPESGLIDLYTEVEVPELGYSSICGNERQPLAVWTEMRGFVALNDFDSLRALFSLDPSDMEPYLQRYSADWAAGRAAGVYQIWPTPFENTPPDAHDYLRLSKDSYCWVVKNRDEVPVEPCLTCEYPGGSLQYTSWERR